MDWKYQMCIRRLAPTTLDSGRQDSFMPGPTSRILHCLKGCLDDALETASASHLPRNQPVAQCLYCCLDPSREVINSLMSLIYGVLMQPQMEYVGSANDPGRNTPELIDIWCGMSSDLIKTWEPFRSPFRVYNLDHDHFYVFSLCCLDTIII